MQPVFSLRRAFQRLFPRKLYASSKQQRSSTPLAHRQPSQALEWLEAGEMALLQGDLSAISFFENATKLQPHEASIWHRIGIAFFDYGSLETQEKALLLASKYFKAATALEPHNFSSWNYWGATLLQLGRIHEEHHFFLDAKEKYQKAIEFSSNQTPETLSELYWDYASVWCSIAEHSGEAVDVSLAIQNFQKALDQKIALYPEFYNDLGNAYIQLGLLVNDARLYLKAIEQLMISVKERPLYLEGWMSLGSAFSQSYINTMDPKFAVRGCQCFETAVKIQPKHVDGWLSWGQLLTESGKLQKDLKQLSSSITKCSRAYLLDSEDLEVTAQLVESMSYLGAEANRLNLLIEAENKVLKVIDTYPEEPDLWRVYGLCLIGFGRYYKDADYFDLAIEKLQYGLSLDRTDAELWHALGSAHQYLAELTDDEDITERASRFFLRAIDLKPSCPSLIYDAAYSLLRHSELSEQLPAIEQSLSLFEMLLSNQKSVLLNHPEWLFHYAWALEWMGELSAEDTYFQKAADMYGQVLLIDPDYPNLHMRLGICHVQLGHMGIDREHYTTAAELFALSVRQDEEDEKAWLEWGLCLVHLAHHTIDEETMNQLYFEAEEKILKAGALGNPHAHYHLACLYSILGRHVDAMRLIRQALHAKALPPLEELLEDEWLDNLRSTKEFSLFLSALEEKLQPREE